MEDVKEFTTRHFEAIVVLVLVAATAVAVFVVVNKVAFLNVFYVPVLVAAYSLGRNRGMLVGALAVLLVTLYSVLDPTLFGIRGTGGAPLQGAYLNLALWGCFLLVTAYVVGSLYEVKESALSDLRQAYEGIVEILSKFIDAVDRDTREHSVRVSELAVQIAAEMRLKPLQIETLRVAGLLHDVGKIHLSLDVLRKASQLTEEEYEHVKTHTQKASDVLQPMGGLLAEIVPLVTFHHECYDGTGYHSRIGEEIPLGARILAVADAYDSMISDRPYRTGRTSEEAMREIDRCTGTQFDPRVAAAFKVVVQRSDVAYA